MAPNVPGSTLREDLFYRLGVVTIHVPPLRERRSDIPILVQSFLDRMEGPRRAVSEDALHVLASYRWPGNVRELLHVVERACVMSSAEVLDSRDFDVTRDGGGRAGSDDELNVHVAMERLERDLIERALVRAEGNRAEAARLLGIARPQLYARMKTLGIAPGERSRK